MKCFVVRDFQCCYKCKEFLYFVDLFVIYILLLSFVSVICIVDGSVPPEIPVTWILRTK